LRTHPLDQKREVAGPAADLEHPLGGFELGLVGELAMRGLDTYQACEWAIQR
jgi:hypothetical protein